MVIEFTVNAVQCIGLHPAYPQELLNEIISAIPSGARVTCVDVPFTQSIRDFFAELTRRGVKLISYIDHHGDDMNPEDALCVIELQKQLGDTAAIVGRRDHPSCAELVQLGRWKKEDIGVCFFSTDFDGFAAALIGAGVSYFPQSPRTDDIVSDAIIMDKGGYGASLSSIGRFIAAARYFGNVPVYVDPHKHRVSLSRTFQILADWIAVGAQWDWPQLAEFRQAVDASRRHACENAISAAQKTRWVSHVDRVILGNFVPAQQRGEHVDTTHWRKVIIHSAVFGKEAILCHKGLNAFGQEVITVEVPPQWRSVDVRCALPYSVRPRSSFRATFFANNFPEFLQLWHQYVRQEHPEILRIAESSSVKMEGAK